MKPQQQLTKQVMRKNTSNRMRTKTKKILKQNKTKKIRHQNNEKQQQNVGKGEEGVEGGRKDIKNKTTEHN